MKNLCYSYINDKYISDNKHSVLDLGLLRSYGIFEFFRSYNKKSFHLDLHLKRMRSSAACLNLSLNYSDEEILIIIEKLFHLNKIDEGYIKLVLTGGVSTDHFFPTSTPTLIITLTPVVKYPEWIYSKGIKLKTYCYERFMPHVKTLNYLPAILAINAAKKDGFFDVLYINHKNHILEATTANFFAIKNSTLITANDEVLPGVTREVVFQLSKQDYKIEKRKLLLEEMDSFDEAFMCASNKEIVPVVQIDKNIIGEGQPGAITKALMQKFYNYTRSKY
jgi:branched-chain amino acid aminotransferase